MGPFICQKTSSRSPLSEGSPEGRTKATARAEVVLGICSATVARNSAVSGQQSSAGPGGSSISIWSSGNRVQVIRWRRNGEFAEGDDGICRPTRWTTRRREKRAQDVQKNMRGGW
ncbi:helicases [Striga asiatica]|uniref:Helicases n=1 Tax=Striga asiatica TaxID=4170 RepID=A0A5A7R8B0_STRAF|nr:helicases [Striga asiatica]